MSIECLLLINDHKPFLALHLFLLIERHKDAPMAQIDRIIGAVYDVVNVNIVFSTWIVCRRDHRDDYAETLLARERHFRQVWHLNENDDGSGPKLEESIPTLYLDRHWVFLRIREEPEPITGVSSTQIRLGLNLHAHCSFHVVEDAVFSADELWAKSS